MILITQETLLNTLNINELKMSRIGKNMYQPTQKTRNREEYRGKEQNTARTYGSEYKVCRDMQRC